MSVRKVRQAIAFAASKVFDLNGEVEQASLGCNTGELRESVLNCIGYKKKFPTLRLEHAFGDAVVEEDEEFVVEAVDVKQKDRLGVDLECVPGEDFEEFLKGTETTG